MDFKTKISIYPSGLKNLRYGMRGAFEPIFTDSNASVVYIKVAQAGKVYGPYVKESCKE